MSGAAPIEVASVPAVSVAPSPSGAPSRVPATPTAKLHQPASATAAAHDPMHPARVSLLKSDPVLDQRQRVAHSKAFAAKKKQCADALDVYRSAMDITLLKKSDITGRQKQEEHNEELNSVYNAALDAAEAGLVQAIAAARTPLRLRASRPAVMPSPAPAAAASAAPSALLAPHVTPRKAAVQPQGVFSSFGFGSHSTR
jgi:hypothetical protein